MSYELSLRGVWPLERYEALKGTLMDLTALLSQLQFVLTTLTLPWRRALLKRTRLMDVRFVSRPCVTSVYLAPRQTLTDRGSASVRHLARGHPRRHLPLLDLSPLCYASTSNHAVSADRTIPRTVRPLFSRHLLLSLSADLLYFSLSLHDRHHGLRIEMGYDEMIHHSDEEEGGVPRHVTAEVLESVSPFTICLALFLLSKADMIISSGAM